MERLNPAFGATTSALYTVTIDSNYYDSNVDINGNVHLGPGVHSLTIKNQGVGRVVILVE